MADTAASRTIYDNVLRYVYTPKLWDLQNRERIMLQIIQKNTVALKQGKRIEIPLHTSSGGGIRWSSTGALPTTYPQATAKAYANYSKLYGKFQIDGDLLLDTDAEYAAEMSALLFEAESLVEDLADALSVDIWGDGNGRLCNVITDTTVSTTTLVVPKNGCFVKKGMIVDVLVSTTGAVTDGGQSKRVVSVTPGTTTTSVVLEAAAMTSASHATYAIFREGSYGAALDGIQKAIFVPGTWNTYLGINRDTAGNEYFRNQYSTNSSVNREPSLDLIQEMVDTIETSSSGKVDLIICSHPIWRKLAKQLTADKRYTGDTKLINGWCTALQFGDNVNIIRDKSAPHNKIYCLDSTTWTLYQDSEGGFIDEDGQILRQVSGYDKFEAAWRRFVALACADPAANGVIDDVAE